MSFEKTYKQGFECLLTNDQKKLQSDEIIFTPLISYKCRK